MRKDTDGTLLFSPLDLVVFMESDFASWMDRFDLENKGVLVPGLPDSALLILRDKGFEHEKLHLQKLKDSTIDVCEITDTSESLSRTIDAMIAGRSMIYQASLRRGEFEGSADFLIKVDGNSRFGNYHYEVWDTKLSRSPKPHFLIQLSCYSEMLEEMQGVLPAYCGVVLENSVEKRFRLHDFYFYYLGLKNAFLEDQKRYDPQDRPIPDGLSDHGRWSSMAEAFLEEIDHLSKVANIRKTQIRKLQKAQIDTMSSLANAQVRTVARMEPTTFSTLRNQARLQKDSLGLEKPKFEIMQSLDSDLRRGLRLLPPASTNDVFFDLEGYPHIEGGLEYLFGMSYFEQSEITFKAIWAHNRTEEKTAFEDFMDWSYQRWLNDPGMHIYHYADYEISALRRLMGRYATRERELDVLLRNEVFVNLFTVVRQSMQVGTPSYSIKQIEHLYRANRETEVATAMDSVVFYHEWLQVQDGTKAETSETLRKIRDYNKDDCDSTAQLAEWLRGIQTQSGLDWIPPPGKTSPRNAAADSRNQASILAQEILSSLPNSPDENRFYRLLAYLLEFHWRESKPVFWAKYARHEMNDEQLIDDANCLGGLERTKSIPRLNKKSVVYEYKFDSSQDNKLDVGTMCFFAHDLSSRAQIETINEEKGLIELRISAKQPEPPQQLGLIPDEFVAPKKLSDSIFRTVSKWHSSKILPPAMEDFLYKRRPQINGRLSGPIVSSDASIDEITEAVFNLQHSTLCIQGPPGCGKTYTAAKVIVSLLADGKKIGVTSHSHKAISKLLKDIASKAVETRLNFSGTKVQSDSSDFGLERTSFVASKSTKDAFTNGTAMFDLVGATAWVFSDENAIESLDYLFVDEAGQVSVANLLAMAPAARSIILMGDHMQLSQPTKGAHPDESALSTLEYLLEGKQTIPEDFGIFLGKTFRMHPDLCNFVSDAIYEGRLLADESTSNRQILIPENSKYPIRNTGIVFIPVEHEGNTQGSDEEAAAIEKIIQQLLNCQIIENERVRSITPDDILLIAPYNVQVRTLKGIHKTEKVGTLDKFQGQEAPIVILSMCSSDGNESARGLEFLFNNNRLNVAISRAKCLSIVVGHPRLARSSCSNVKQMELINLFCNIAQSGRIQMADIPKPQETQVMTDSEEKLDSAIQQCASDYYRLVVLAGPSGSGKTTTLVSTAARLGYAVVNVNLELSMRMLELTKVQRTRQVEKLLKEIIAATNSNTVVLDNIEILFDTSLELEPLRLLQGCSRNHTLIASWPGSFANGTLTYAEPGHPEYIQYKQTDAIVVPVASANQLKEPIAG